MSQNPITDYLTQTQMLFEQMCVDNNLQQQISAAIEILCNTFSEGNKVLFAGNGGSAADAQHMATEYVVRFQHNRPGLAAIALTTDTSALTAIGNDFGFEQIFARQVEALGQAGDVFIAYSTSGTSPNILAALRVAREKQLVTIGFTGIGAGSREIAELSDCCLHIPSAITSHIQEGHLAVGHLICGAVEARMFGRS